MFIIQSKKELGKCKRAMTTAEEYHKLPVAKAITVVDLSRIDVHTNLAGAPVTVCTEDGCSFRVPEKMQGVARKAFEALAKGSAAEVGKGKLCDVLKAVAGVEEQQEEEDNLASLANRLAGRVIDEFAAEFKSTLLRKLKDRRDSVVKEVFETLLQ